MSKATVNQVIQRAISDAAFRRQLQRDPGSALSGFDLTTDERAAITSGDPARLTTLGVDQRMSKAFVIGGMGEASKAIVTDAGASGSAVLVDESAMTGQGALIDDGAAAGHGALIDSGATSGSAVIVGDPTAPDTEGFLPTINAGDTSSAATTAGGDYYPEMTLPSRGAGDTTSAATVEAGGEYYPEMTLPSRGAGDTSSAATVSDTLDTSGDLNVIDPGLTNSATAFEPESASGDLNVLDAGVTGGSSNSGIDTETGATTQGLEETGRDTGGDVHPNEY